MTHCQLCMYRWVEPTINVIRAVNIINHHTTSTEVLDLKGFRTSLQTKSHVLLTIGISGESDIWGQCVLDYTITVKRFLIS